MTEEEAAKVAEEMCRGLSDEELDNLIAQMECNTLMSQFRDLHIAFLESQAIVMQVSWGKDAIREVLNNAL